jgi:hypothetical protein
MGDIVMNGDFQRIGRIAAGLHETRRFHGHVAGRALPLFEQRLVRMAGSEHNRFGVRGGFWNRMLSGTKAVATEEAAIIRMPREVRLRHLGGTVRPKKAKFLAIPQTAEAYGKSPRQFTDLKPVRVRGRLWLVRRLSETVRFRRDRKSGEMRTVSGGLRMGGTKMFLLVRSATIKPNPEVLPSRVEIEAAAVEGAKAFVREVTGQH